MAFVASSYPVPMAEDKSSNTISSTDFSADSQSTSIFSARSRRQFSLFFAGATFVALSALVTRRSFHKRHLATIPHFFQPSNGPPRVPINGAMEALEALNLATVNVTSFTIMIAGGLLWAFDISGLEELKRRVRAELVVDGIGRRESDAEEFGEWLATALERKREKEENGTEKNESKNWMDQAREAFEEEREEARTNERGKRR